MRETKFTPGPWLLTGGECPTVYALHQDGWTRGKPCMVNRFWARIDAHRDCPPEEGRANAHLIASAPEMYRALVALVEHADAMESRNVDFHGMGEQGIPFRSAPLGDAIAALQRARGKTP